ncbi:Tannase/feruloyl esterase [Colletotrichum phormii]|uniref:Carboxylic ester hydrolase n=1 Tax=Colletotrichum phormii TaxID=359342 RepID=A0AAJ0EN45_9PEZI|nr:Tannase/feruloyl esterase [Colletotrichum phormii]KAK1655113.1 Tannase/feruloyl esterase [Colletotrichum phormii]
MSALSCVPATFGNVSLFGAEILSLQTNLVTNYTISVPSSVRFTQPSIEVQNASFCNITVTYTHPGQGDIITFESWLPTEGWNGRLQAVGGGGWVAGRSDPFFSAMGGAVGDGYATITTDAGLGNSLDASSWALLSPGNVNLYNLQNLASVSLDDGAVIGKSLIQSYYGREPDYSYWNGCSQGGRQGLMLAQRYPTQYDGIAAGAPGIQWTDFFPSMLWPQQFMDIIGQYPHACELTAITAAAVSACDDLDGVKDGIIEEVDACLDAFNPFDIVGRDINCTGAPTISYAAAAVVNATWQGMRDSQGVQLWPGLNPDTDLTVGVAATICTTEPCRGVPLSIATQWLSLFVARDPDIDLSNLSHVEFDWLAHQGRQRYNSIIGTDDPDLSAFRDAGGKLITFHGLVDELLPPKGSIKYYNTVSDLIPGVHDFYRHFEVPGMGHCSGGRSGEPISLFDQLRAWVENGTAPDHTPFKVTISGGDVQDRILCPYPQKAVVDPTCDRTLGTQCWSCGGNL